MKNQYHHNIDTDISSTYIVANKKLTFVATLGVTIGVTIFIFMNSLGSGFVKKSNTAIFNNTPHIRVYNDDRISTPITPPTNSRSLALISNPMVVPKSDRIIDPQKTIKLLRIQPGVTIATPEIAVKIFYNSGTSKIPGDASGVEIGPASEMFQIKTSMVEGQMEDLEIHSNGILLGVGIAAKMNAKTGDNISITSSRNVTKIMKVVGLFRTNNSSINKTKCYIRTDAAQQLIGENASYVTNINVNVADFTKAADYSDKFSTLTGYKAEDWKTANSDQLSGFKMRSIIIFAMSLSILLVAGFGTYNILNMTITQRINDIAILKAMGFQGWDVIKIFVMQGMLIAVLGISIGLLLALAMVYGASNIYMGADTGYFPIVLDYTVFINGCIFGLVIAFFASYLPARKAANVDPVSIFRK